MKTLLSFRRADFFKLTDKQSCIKIVSIIVVEFIIDRD